MEFKREVGGPRSRFPNRDTENTETVSIEKLSMPSLMGILLKTEVSVPKNGREPGPPGSCNAQAQSSGKESSHDKET